MFALGFIFVLTGIFLAAFNERVARNIGYRQYYSEDFSYSIPRQNIAGIGVVLVFGGCLMIYLS